MKVSASKNELPGKEVALNASQDQQNDALMIWVSQDTEPVTWVFEVWAQTKEGKTRVGDVVLQPVYNNASNPLTAGDPPCRAVAVAYFPGVQTWSVVPLGFAPDDQGQLPTIDIYLTSSPKPASVTAVGVFAIQQGGLNPGSSVIWRDLAPTNSVAVPGLNFQGDPLLTLRKARGVVTTGGAIAGHLTIMFFDQATAPIAPNVPFARVDVTDTQRNWEIDFGPGGHPLASGNLAFGVSAQYATYSPSAVTELSDANLEFGI